MATFWVDGDPGKPLGLLRTIGVVPIPRGDPVFSLVTFPRCTQAVWNESSSRCAIMNAPDNGNVYFWMVRQAGKEKWGEAIWKTTPFDPMKSLAEAFLAHWDEHRLWRPGVLSMTWQDDQTLIIEAVDNNGAYSLTVSADDLDHPKIEKRQRKKDE